ncbi:MAG: response regulator transcription factor [Bdellovibrionales bacterium]
MAHVLIVEDDYEYRLLLSHFFRLRGLGVHTATSGGEAFRDLRSGLQVDVIVSDIMMEDGDGFEFLRALRSLNIPIPLIFISALGSEIEAHVRRAGAQACLRKPIDFKRLMCLVSELTTLRP